MSASYGHVPGGRDAFVRECSGLSPDRMPRCLRGISHRLDAAPPPMQADEIRFLFAYDRWATRQLLGVIDGLAPPVGADGRCG